MPTQSNATESVLLTSLGVTVKILLGVISNRYKISYFI